MSENAAAHKPDDIIMARRTADHDVSIGLDGGLYALVERAGFNDDGTPKWQPSAAIAADQRIHKGDVIPMRYEEALGREDFEPVEG